MVALSVPPQRLPVNLVRSGRKQPQREHRVPGCGWRGRLHFRPAIFRRPSTLLSVALQYLLDLSAALHFLERLQYRFHRNLRGIPHQAAHCRFLELRGFLEWRLPRRLAVAPVQRQLMADRVAVAAGAQLFQHQVLGARIVAAQSVRCRTALASADSCSRGRYRYAGPAAPRESARSLRGRPGCRVAPAARRSSDSRGSRG